MRVRRALVTGGTGFLGRALVRRLLARGEAVCLLTRPGREAASEELLQTLGARPDQGLVRTDASGLAVSKVFHLAGARTLGSLTESLTANLEASVRLRDLGAR